MELLYISSAPSEKEFRRIKSCIKLGASHVADMIPETVFKFHTLIQEGLTHSPHNHMISLVGRSVSFKIHNGLFWNAKKENINENRRIKHLGFINIPVLKQLILGVSFFFHTLGWLQKHRKIKDKYIIMDAAYITVIPFVVLASWIVPCKKAAIFADIFTYMAKVSDSNGTGSLFHKLMRGFVGFSYKQLDGFILLTEDMNPVVNKKNRPYLVMEGLVDINMGQVEIAFKDKYPKNVILYAGGLRKQYGLENLVNGFMNYEDEDAQLWIFGDGDYIPEIRNAAKKDPRIIFGGMITNKEVVEKELQATLLINPRPANQEFTRFSFPSKNMEYMVSGTPVLTTRLPGMPQEYYEYVYTIDGHLAEDVTRALQEVFALPKQVLYDKGKASRLFVLREKNNIAQAERIEKFVREL